MEESAASAGTDKLERPGAIADDALHLKRRVGLLSGVALIVGTMIGKQNLFKQGHRQSLKNTMEIHYAYQPLIH